MYFLGIDTSTTSSKALLIDERGNVVAVASNPHTLQTPKPLWSEQDPREWWDAVSASIRSVLESAGIGGEGIGAVGLTGQMHGLVLLDGDGNVLRPAILWNDQRTQNQCDEIHQIIGKEKFIQITGNVALTGFTAPKILWVKQREPEVFAKTKHVLLPKDYVRYKLTGEYAMDKADGAGTVLFDLKERDWSDDVLSALEIPHTWMPKTFEGTEFTGYINNETAKLTGLKLDTPVAAGGGSGSGSCWCWCCRTGYCWPNCWHKWRGICYHAFCVDRTRREASCVLPCCTWDVAFHGCDAIGGGKFAVVSRYSCAEREF